MEVKQEQDLARRYPWLIHVDDEIAPLVAALNDAGVVTDWSCAGGPGHMCARATIQARTWCGELTDDAHAVAALIRERRAIERVLATRAIEDYWLCLVFTRRGGPRDTHGGEPTWLLQLGGRYDWLALPVCYSAEDMATTDAAEAAALQRPG